jgi:hypothetical protein
MRAGAFARIVLGLLVLASVAAFFYAQALKREDPLVMRPKAYTDSFQPSGTGRPLDRAAHFDVRTSIADVLDISVVTPSDHPVALIATGLHVRKYVSVPLHWDGRTAAGSPAPPGSYEVVVRFQQAGQSVTIPGFLLRLEGPSG